jgi:hypothetical protein
VRNVAFFAALLISPCAVSVAAAGNELVAVRVPLDSDNETCDGCEIVRIDPDGQTTVLAQEFAAAKDPSVSFDGRTILFAGRPSQEDRWQIWRIDDDGSNLVTILADDGNATAPLHVGSLFHLDDERPSGRFVYLSDAHGWGDPVTGKAATALYSADLDGNNRRRISFNIGSDLAPDVLGNGRLVFPSRRAGGRFSVMALNIDGTDLTAYADAHTGPLNHDMVAVGQQRVYFISGNALGPLGGGALEYVSRRRPLRVRGAIAATGESRFHSPQPQADGSVIVSALAKGGRSGYRLIRLDPETGRTMAEIAAADGYHLVDAQVLSPRPEVQGRSSFVNPDQSTGVFFCVSSHISDRPGLRDAVRSATQLRVIEGIPSAPGAPSSAPTARRTLGILPIERDGSFHIEVPDSIPVVFELLNAAGELLARQDHWVWVMPRESRGCIGCHEDREMVPPNTLAAAVVKPAVRLPMETETPEQTGDRQ